MKTTIAIIFLFFQIFHVFTQNVEKKDCINLECFKGHNLFLHTSTDRLMNFIGNPDFFTLGRELDFFHRDSMENVSYKQLIINSLVYKNIKLIYWENGESVWIHQIHFDNTFYYTILYDEIIFNRELHIDEFLKYFQVQKHDIVSLNKQKYFASAKDRAYYTSIGIPVCGSQYSEFVEFYFDKKGFLQSMVFQIIGF